MGWPGAAEDAGSSPDEVERLRLLDESLFQAVADLQLRDLDGA